MNQLIIFFLTTWLFVPKTDFCKDKFDANKYEYWAVKYSMPIDYSRAYDGALGIQSHGVKKKKIVKSYHYYIQYGKNIVFEIVDPGFGMEFIGILMNKWDYSKERKTFTHCLNSIKKYSTSVDTILFSLKKSKGLIKSLCGEETLRSECDSVNFYLYPHEFVNLKLNTSIPNIRSHMLFFPDIKYLPTKISTSENGGFTLTLEDIFYGKITVDSLLQEYTCGGNSLFTDKEEEEIKQIMKSFKPPK